VNQQRAVVVVLAADPAPPMVRVGVAQLDLEHSAIRPHDRLELGRRREAGDLGQVLLGVAGSDACDRPHLRVAELAVAEGRANLR
jgi:hypothetical protein